jgi:hypothetical protein
MYTPHTLARLWTLPSSTRYSILLRLSTKLVKRNCFVKWAT